MSNISTQNISASAQTSPISTKKSLIAEKNTLSAQLSKVTYFRIGFNQDTGRQKNEAMQKFVSLNKELNTEKTEHSKY